MLKKLLRKTKSNNKETFSSINFATESVTPVKTFAFFAMVFLIFVLILSVNSIRNSRVLKSMAAGTAVGSKVFCGATKLCGDGRCEGEVWRECDSCPKGMARAVVEVSCGEYVRSGCGIEDVLCQ